MPHFIALDTHCLFSEMAVVTQRGKLVLRERRSTTIPELVAALDQVRRPRYLTFEEGPLADWLSRNLQPVVDKLVVCDPRRNHLVTKEGDKDDPIDAEKLAHLFRGGYLKEVHQAQTLERSLLKQQVSFYHDRVRERVRQGHQAVALLRRHGVFCPISELADTEYRLRVWKRLPASVQLRRDVERVLEMYDFLFRQEREIRDELTVQAQREEPVRRFQELPGFGWIRAVTFYVYVDTPHRFRNKAALWRYCGIGLRRLHSGKGPTRTLLDPRGNRHLKNVLLGAAKSAITQADGPFADKYHHWTFEEGLPPSEARRNVARALGTTLWSLWKSGQKYDPALVRGVSGSPAS